MFAAVLVGFVFGFFGSMPVAGPASALVLSRGLMGRFQSGVMLGLGCSVAEGFYAFGAYWGFATFLASYPVIEGVSHVVAAGILLALGVTFARYRTAKAAGLSPASESAWKSASLGFSVTILNPALLATWTASATTLHSAGVDIERGTAWAFGVGVTGGIASWFSILIGLLKRYRERFREEVLNRCIRVIGVLIFGLGVFFAYKAVRHFTGDPEPPPPSAEGAAAAPTTSSTSLPQVPSAIPTSSAPAPLTARLSVKGLSGRVPDFFVPFDPEQLARMEQNARLGDASLEVEVAGMKDPGPRAARGALTLIRTAKKLDAARRGTVRQHLEAQAASMRLLLELGGMKPTRWETKVVGAALEITGSVPLPVRGESVEQVLRSWVFVAPPDQTIELDASCGPSAQGCDALLSALELEATERRPLDDVLGPPREPVTAVAGFRFGSTQAEFKSACKSAGAKLEALRAGDATSDLARWEREGRLLTCSGPGERLGPTSGAFPLQVSLAQGVFHEGRLSRVFLHTPEAVAVVKTKLGALHPCLVEDANTGTCFFAPAAAGAEARSVGILPLSAAHAKTVAVFDSPLAVDR
jgi:threonine/homoserine/homoserine lactone efflux protein